MTITSESDFNDSKIDMTFERERNRERSGQMNVRPILMETLNNAFITLHPMDLRDAFIFLCLSIVSKANMMD